MKKNRNIVNDVKALLRDKWVDVKEDINFSKEIPVSASNSLHIHCEIYELYNETYRVLYEIADKQCTPIVQRLVK